MVKESALQETLLKRAKRLEGQVHGIQRMAEEGRDCESAIAQMRATCSGIDGVAALVLSNYVKVCFSEGNGAESSSVNSLTRVIATWGRVRVDGRI